MFFSKHCLVWVFCGFPCSLSSCSNLSSVLCFPQSRAVLNSWALPWVTWLISSTTWGKPWSFRCSTPLGRTGQSPSSVTSYQMKPSLTTSKSRQKIFSLYLLVYSNESKLLFVCLFVFVRFPLFARGSEKALFQYAVFLLNKDIAQVSPQMQWNDANFMPTCVLNSHTHTHTHSHSHSHSYTCTCTGHV